MHLGRQWFEGWRPDRTDHDAGIDVVVRPPTLLELSGPSLGSVGLQRFGYSHQQSRRFRLVCLRLKVEKPANHIDPIHRVALPVLMIAAIQDDLQLIPGRGEIFVGQRAAAHAGRSIGDVGSRRSGVSWDGVAPGAGIRGRAQRGRALVLRVQIPASFPTSSPVAKAAPSKPYYSARAPRCFCFAEASEEGAPGFRPLREGGNNRAKVVTP